MTRRVVRRLFLALAALVVAVGIWIVILIEPVHNACDCLPPRGHVSGGYACNCPVDRGPQYVIGGSAAAIAAATAAIGFAFGRSNDAYSRSGGV
jgi:hypothetical protein